MQMQTTPARSHSLELRPLTDTELEEVRGGLFVLGLGYVALCFWWGVAIGLNL